MSNHVIIKGKNDRLVIVLDPDIDFLDLCDVLKTKILDAKNFIGSSRMAIEFSGRTLTNDEENKLIGIITYNSNIVISYIFSKKIDSEENMNIDSLNSLVEEGRVNFYRGTLRSGSKIESDGSIVVIGDVNPSSIIKAKGNVIVIGHLNGAVYAGLGGDDRAFIAAVYFNPIQITIGIKTRTDIQNEILDSSRVDKRTRFKVASIKNKEIVVEELI